MASQQKGFMPGAQGQYQGGQMPLGVTPGQLAGGYQPQGSRSAFNVPAGNQGPPRPMPGSPEKAAFGSAVGGAALSAPPLQGTQIPSSGPAAMPGPAPMPAGPSPLAAGPLPQAAQTAEPGPMPSPAPPPGGGMTGGPLTPNPPPPGNYDKPGGAGYTGVNPYTQKPAQYGKIMPGAGGPGPLRPPGFQNG